MRRLPKPLRVFAHGVTAPDAKQGGGSQPSASLRKRRSPGPGTTEFGAAWKKTARETGRDYLSVKLDDPSFPAPIYASLVEGEEQGTFALIWSRLNAD